ncbi:hypothetical protein ASF12_13850 [Paenibacillus sp. Leaf72]|nr:hypothetical protein ASF12_13850 [Paenibacillus sp. Leaf72]
MKLHRTVVGHRHDRLYSATILFGTIFGLIVFLSHMSAPFSPARPPRYRDSPFLLPPEKKIELPEGSPKESDDI